MKKKQIKAHNRYDISKWKFWLETIAVLVVLQALRALLRRCILLVIPYSHFSDSMISMVVMSVLFVGFGWLCYRKNALPTIYSRPFGWGLCLAIAGFVLAFGSGLWFAWLEGAQGIWLLIYGSLVTPLYEEAVFRGWLWQRLQTAGASTWQILFCNALLFGLWHLGYAESLSLRVSPEQLVGVLVGKVAVGILYGWALGWVRSRSHGWLAPALLHGALNVFG